jgi:hypothetical protein
MQGKSFTRRAAKFFLLLGGLIALPGQLSAQNEKKVDNESLAWGCYFGTFRFTDRWSLWNELQLRRADFLGQWQQVLPRVGLNYHLNPNVIFTLGYAYLWTYPYGKQPLPLDQPRYEHRPWQQVTLLHNSGKVSFAHRFRLEQRFLQNWTFVDSATGLRSIRPGYEWQNRMRYRFLLTIPFPTPDGGRQKWFATAYDEIFINFGPNIGYNLFDQNRLGGTLGYWLNKNVNLQLGYMNQYIQKANGRDVENNHALTLFVVFNLDLREPAQP